MTNWVAGIASIFVAALGQVNKGEFLKGLKIFLTVVLLGTLRIVVPLHFGNADQPFAPMPIFNDAILIVTGAVYSI